MQKIYCVEDDESIRQLILYALSSGGFEAKGFECGEEFFDELKNSTPDLVLLDVMLPDEDGFSILKKIRKNTNMAETSVIMLTAKSTEYDKVKGLDLGADDYITKPFGVLELLSRIRAVLRRSQKAEKSDIIVRSGVELNLSKRMVFINENQCSLTFKEFELLYYLMSNSGIVLSRDKILSKVWGYDFEGESRTVDMHIKTLRQKLADYGADEVIKTIRSVGYKFE